MRYIFALLLMLATYGSNAQSQKQKQKIWAWRNETERAIQYNGSTETAELCKFYHEGIYKGKVYTDFINQTPDEFCARAADRNGCLKCSFWLGWFKIHPPVFYQRSPDWVGALPYFTKAADAGNLKAIMILASEVYGNNSTISNPALAYEWYKKAAAMGDSTAIARVAKLNIAHDDPFSKGMAAYNNKNYVDAEKYWAIAYEMNNNAQAAYNLALMNINGTGMMKNSEQAHMYYFHACELGIKEACLEDGELYYAEGNYFNAAGYLLNAQQKGCVVNQSHIDVAVSEKKKITDKWDAEKRAEEAYQAGVELHARQRKEREQAAAQNNNSSNTGNNSQKRTDKKCPYCNGAGTIETAGSKGLTQDKNGRWYNTYTPRSFTACSHCKGTGYL